MHLKLLLGIVSTLLAWKIELDLDKSGLFLRPSLEKDGLGEVGADERYSDP